MLTTTTTPYATGSPGIISTKSLFLPLGVAAVPAFSLKDSLCPYWSSFGAAAKYKQTRNASVLRFESTGQGVLTSAWWGGGWWARGAFPDNTQPPSCQPARPTTPSSHAESHSPSTSAIEDRCATAITSNVACHRLAEPPPPPSDSADRQAANFS